MNHAMGARDALMTGLGKAPPKECRDGIRAPLHPLERDLRVNGRCEGDRAP